MTRKKTAILALSASVLLATGIVGAPGVQATGESVAEFTCLDNDKTNVHCTGFGEAAFYHSSETDKTHKFAAGAFSVLCSVAESAMTTDDDGELVVPQVETQYKNCEAGGNVVDVYTNECEYYFFVEEKNEEYTEQEYRGSATLHCPAEESLKIEVTKEGAPRCIIHLYPQATIGPVYFRNMSGSSPTDITVEMFETVANAQFTPVGGSLFLQCGVLTENSKVKIYGNTTLRATDTEGAVIDARID